MVAAPRDFLHVVLLGPPGSGKGTQADLLELRLGLFHLSTGELLRLEIAQNSELGKQAQHIVSTGNLVPDNLMGQMVKQRLATIYKEDQNGIVFDGYPRNYPQAEELDQVLTQFSSRVNAVVKLDIESDGLLKRLSGRRVCPRCQRNYNVYFQPPKNDELCDDCGITLTHREDDRKAVVKRRLAIYQKETEELVDFYQSRGIVFEVEGVGDVEQVYNRIAKIVQALPS